MSSYPHPAHREENRGRILDFIEATTLGALVTFVDGEFSSTSLPFTLSADGGRSILEAHIPRNNPQAKHGRSRTMVLFQGPSAYVRPGWYETKRRTDRGVPTWNYMVAKVHGELEVVDDPAFVLDQITRLTARQEGGSPYPWAPSDAPTDYIDAMTRSLVGIRIVVDRLEAVWKLSGNQPAANREGVVAGLRARGGDDANAIAREIEQRLGRAG